ncbi:hypothetical protein [Acinetobacter modestus]|uniref:hypothetical protein n=1 Tax=Acinetobacter modestus TaxID=1776740 RepID=UPI001F4A7A0C|nr:hypothetical protein [Acinetobacter modestus]MCH7328093.1 hypothetical protein [Acinetobacter modestus]
MNIEREAFEQLPDIKGILQDGYGFNSELNQYFHPDIENHRLGCAYLMGGWMAYQAQSKKLEGCVVVPVQCPDPDFADSLFDELSKRAIGGFGDDLMIHFSNIDEEKIWALMVEAARGGNE